MQEEAQGSVFWHDKGLKLYRKVENYIRDRLDDAGYQEVRTPQRSTRQDWMHGARSQRFATPIKLTPTGIEIRPTRCRSAAKMASRPPASAPSP